MIPIFSPNKYRLILVGIILFILSGKLTAKVIQIPVFGWIKPQYINTNDTIPSDEIQDGCFFMLSDNQNNLKNHQFYSHFAYKLVSELGVQNNSEIQINYNPSYQKFYLHGLRIYRDGKKIDGF